MTGTETVTFCETCLESWVMPTPSVTYWRDPETNHVRVRVDVDPGALEEAIRAHTVESPGCLPFDPHGHPHDHAHDHGHG